MNLYETILILDPSLEENAAEKIVEKVKGIISKHSGEILKTENWGKRRLAYTIKKQNKGLYVLITFKAVPDVLEELDRLFKVSDQFLKTLTIKLEKKQAEAVMSSLTETAEKTSAETPPQETAQNA